MRRHHAQYALLLVAATTVRVIYEYEGQLRASSLASSAGCTCSARMSAYRGKSDGCASSGLLFSVGSAMQEAETAATVEPTSAAPVGMSRGRAAMLRAWRRRASAA